MTQTAIYSLYTNGEFIWNKNHQVMLNGAGLSGSGEAPSQPALILKLPGSQTKFYVFTVGSKYGNLNGLHYNVIDLSLDGGLGGIVTGQKDIAILEGSDANEVITGYKHANGKDYWIIVRKFNNDKFAVFKFTSAGIDVNPIFSQTRYITTTAITRPMRCSPDGHLLLCPFATTSSSSNSEDIEICDFNSQTGAITFKYTLKEFSLGVTLKDMEISPDSKLLYCVFPYSDSPPQQHIYQYDLTQSDSLNLLLSKIIISGNAGLMQLAPDGKIYSRSYDYSTGIAMFPDSLSVINKPWVRGSGCDFNLQQYILEAL
ncbi:MAG: hypothetical protein IPP79_21075 [Chitinophagaceae bacterium]|nr:hypothetical protein [Chitinophagaceae bacterium]